MSSIEQTAISGAQITPAVPLSTTNKAAHAALSTNELLCNIVARLPFKDILAATGVCRGWRAALLGDPNIREDLFLKPAEVRLVLADEKYVRETEGSIPLAECCILGSALPLLRKIFDTIYFDVGMVMFVPNAKKALLRDKPHFMPQVPPSDSEIANTFWRDMSITQPPCSTIGVRIFACEDRASRSIGEPLCDVKLQRADGIKLADLYDIFQLRLEEEHSQYITFLSVLNWVPGELVEDNYSVHGQVRCEVHNGEVQRPAPPIL